MRELSVNYTSCAWVKPGAAAARVAALAADLEGCGFTHVQESAQRLEFEVPADAERFVLIGGLARLLSTYGDVVTWTPRFSEHGRG